MEDLILTPYAPNLVESTRSIGYSFETALADIIDNSISNNATRIDVKFSNNKDPFVAIIDNGNGMNATELQQAMQYGSSNSLDIRGHDDLGRFGLGLKMASMSQCRKLTVISKKKGELSAATWDLEYIHQTKKWSLILYSEKEISELKLSIELSDYHSGTVVIWEMMDRISESSKDFEREFDDKIDSADKHISLVFHRFLENPSSRNYIEVYFNNRKIEAVDPFMLSNHATQQLEEETIFIDGTPIKVTPFIMPFTSKLSSKEMYVLNEYKELNLKQGLYIYRNHRLIVWGKWFRLVSDSELKRLAKIRIDLPNTIDTHWKLDIKKSSAQIPSTIKEQLKQIISRTVGKSEKVYKYRGRAILKEDHHHVWNRIENRGKLQYLINRQLPTFEVLQESLDDNQFNLLEGFINTLEHAFPYSAVYYDLAQDKQYVDNGMEFNQVYELAKTTINNLSVAKEEKLHYLDKLSNIDLFHKYPEVIRKLKKEIDECE